MIVLAFTLVTTVFFFKKYLDKSDPGINSVIVKSKEYFEVDLAKENFYVFVSAIGGSAFYGDVNSIMTVWGRI
jgi:predicted membrane-bound mannosyltransferase